MPSDRESFSPEVRRYAFRKFADDIVAGRMTETEALKKAERRLKRKGKL